MISRLLSSPLVFVFGLAALPTYAQVAGTPSGPAPTNALAAPAPTATPAPTDTSTPASAAPKERPSTYTMEAGDSLDSIGRKFDTSIHALAKLNKIPESKYRKLRVGTVLQIPPAKTDTSAK